MHPVILLYFEDCGSGWVVHELTLAGLESTTVTEVLASPEKLELLQNVAAQAQQHMHQPSETRVNYYCTFLCASYHCSAIHCCTVLC